MAQIADEGSGPRQTFGIRVGAALLSLQNYAEGSDDPAEVARCLAHLRDLKADVAIVADDVERHLLACMGERQLVVDGLGVVETRKRTKRTKWDHDALVRDILAAWWNDPQTQDEERMEEWDVAVEAIHQIRQCIGLAAGKVTALRARGLQPDEYCEETPDGWTVQLPPRNHGHDI